MRFDVRRSAVLLVLAACHNTVEPQRIIQEPKNFQLITEREFRSKVEDGWLDVGDARFTIQDISGAPRGDGKVGQALFQSGFTAGVAPINTYYVIPGDNHQLYVGMWIKFSPNFQGQDASINKILFIWTDANANVFLNAQGQGSGPLRLGLNLQNNVGGAIRLWGNQPDDTFSRGVWHFVEVLLVANTVGQKNGSAKMWLDGKQIGNWTGIGPARDKSNRWEMISWNPTWGGAGGIVAADMYQQIDYLRVSGIP